MPNVIPLHLQETTSLKELSPGTGPQRLRISLGMRQLALSMLRNAFEDCLGRSVGVYGNRQKERRLNASNSIRWLRQAGRLSVRGKAIPADLRHEYVLSIDWCAEVLDVDAKQLASDGIHCIPNSGLRNWRQWRSSRNENRNKAHPIRQVRCGFCGVVLQTRHLTRQFCSQRCVGLAMSARSHANRQAAGQVVTDTTNARSAAVTPYERYTWYADLVGSPLLTIEQWRILSD